MKGLRYSAVAILAASGLMAGNAPGPDKSASFNQGMPSFADASITLAVKPAPQLVLANDTRITGLLADGAHPGQAWNLLLNPPAPARNLPALTAPVRPPVVAPVDFNDDLAVHEPDLALLRISLR